MEYDYNEYDYDAGAGMGMSMMQAFQPRDMSGMCDAHVVTTSCTPGSMMFLRLLVEMFGYARDQEHKSKSASVRHRRHNRRRGPRQSKAFNHYFTQVPDATNPPFPALILRFKLWPWILDTKPMEELLFWILKPGIAAVDLNVEGLLGSWILIAKTIINFENVPFTS